MGSDKNNILSKLRKGEKIVCPLCNSGFIEPFVLAAEKARDFNCSNENCNYHYHLDYNIDID